jgi:hypothetical protein
MTLYKEPTEPLNRRRRFSGARGYRWTLGFGVGVARYVCFALHISWSLTITDFCGKI